MPRPSLRGTLDREVYQVLTKLEGANDGKPFKAIHHAYNAIQQSNSSLKRQKKRPLEDAIDRVLVFRREEMGDSEDSEAKLEEVDDALANLEDERFLLNRQMVKHWHNPSRDSPITQPNTDQNKHQNKHPEVSEPASKKLRIQNKEDTSHKQHNMSTNDTARLHGAAKENASKKRKRFTVEYSADQDVQPLGGVADIEQQLYKDIHASLKRPELYNTLKFRPILGMLLSGPKGSGKKSLVRSVASSLEVPLICLNPCFEDPERMEKRLDEAIDEAVRVAPSVIFIERIDQHLSKGSQSHAEYDKRAVAIFERHMIRLRSQPADRHVLAVATTSDVTEIHGDMLGSNCFEMTLQMKIPNAKAREDIFRVVTRGAAMKDDVDFGELAQMTHGFVGADIKIAVTLAQRRAVRARRSDTQGLHHTPSHDPSAINFDVARISSQASAPEEILTMEDLTTVFKTFTPSLRKEGFSVIPNVTWNQVGALVQAREQLDTSIIGPIKDPVFYESWGLSRPTGVLLWGPPGCGKTLIAQAVANEAQASFILINGPELLNKYVGESERAVRDLFQRARSSTPCILFFDEIDSLVPKRQGTSTESGVRVVNALLTELDGVKDRSGIYVIGTTNRPDMIDAAMLRPGRLSVRIFMDLPTADERVAILKTLFTLNHPKGTDTKICHLETVARDPRCKDFSGADLNALRVKAVEHGMRRYIKGDKTVKMIDAKDWEAALKTTRRSVLDPEMYRELAREMDERC